MKRIVATISLFLCLGAAVHAQDFDAKVLPYFNEISFEGNAKIHLIEGDEPMIEVDFRKNRYEDLFVAEVRNEVLYINFREDYTHSLGKEIRKNKRIELFITHAGVETLNLSGFVKLISDGPFTSGKLNIEADGFIKGDIEVDVQRLSIEASGFIGLKVFGEADDANLQLDGFGRINAKGLQSRSTNKHSDGFGRVKTSR